MRGLADPHHLSAGELLLLRRFLDGVLASVPAGSITAIRVFGSRARGLSHEDSDLDVAVEAAPDADRAALLSLVVAAGQKAMDALDLRGLQLSPIVLPHAVGPDRRGIYNAIDREGIELWPST